MPVTKDAGDTERLRHIVGKRARIAPHADLALGP